MQNFWHSYAALKYPYAVKYGQGTDGQGVEWEIGYMDEYTGTEENPPVLVLIHGKGAHAGCFGHLMQRAVAAGFRVIAPDLPHYGFSIPWNLEKPLTRTLQDAREALYDLLVQQLGIERAIYLGHSMGGQWAMGFALQHPDCVEKLILQSPAGLEEFPKNVLWRNQAGAIIELPLFDPSYERDLDKWHEVWDQTGFLELELSKNAEQIEHFYFYKRKNRETGALEPTQFGYFKKETEWARIYTEIRQNMIDLDSIEYLNYVKTYVRDMYSIGIELNRDDPNSLTKQIPQLKMPIMLMYGLEECMIPAPIFSGKTHLLHDVIYPACDLFAQTGQPFTLKLYPQVGHFIQTDAPDLFADDVLKFAFDAVE